MIRFAFFLLITGIIGYGLWNGVHHMHNSEGQPEQSADESRVKDGKILLNEEIFTQSGLATAKAVQERGQITIPTNAVIWWDDKAWVYAEQDNYIFLRVPVEITATAENGNYAVTGIAPSAAVVTTGAQLLLSEEMRGNMHMEDN